MRELRSPVRRPESPGSARMPSTPAVPPRYHDNGDGTVTDLNSGLIWQQSADANGDGVIDTNDKFPWPEPPQQKEINLSLAHILSHPP